MPDPVLVTTPERIRIWLGADASEAKLDAIIAGVSLAFERYLNRRLLLDTFSERFNVRAGGQRLFSVFASPIATVTAITADGEAWDFDEESTADRFSFNGSLIQFEEPIPEGIGNLTIGGTGGMAATTAAFVAGYPDIAMAADLYVQLLFRRAKTIDHTATAVQGASTTHASTALPQQVREVLDLHRRAIA